VNTVTETVKKEEAKERKLTLTDRCDSGNCGAAAYVCVTGVTGKLFFCAHHFNKIIINPAAKEKLISFAYEILDEREFLEENRLKED
jgi:hypothetical protein